MPFNKTSVEQLKQLKHARHARAGNQRIIVGNTGFEPATPTLSR